MLVMCKLYQRQWMVTVADAQTCSSAVGTRRELEFGLQAWLNPLPPPKLEQLSDLR